MQILRDTWGVPHVFGKTDADAAFGLAYAHAEDDWPTIENVAAASTGRLSLLQLTPTALLADCLAGLIGVRELVEEQWPKLDPRTRALLDGYANGLNYYAALHPDESDARLAPFSGKDVAAGFVYKMPVLIGMPQLLQDLRAHTPRAGEQLARGASADGSNAHALAPFRSTDGATRLNVNSHQPWEGPVAWYEAQVASDEGWNMYSGLFPGSPVVLHGFNDKIGWAHTVNWPAALDAYELQIRDGKQLLDGEWVAMRERKFSLQIDLGFATLPVPLTFQESAQGPIFEAHGHSYAIRWAGRERSALTVEQWYRMNRAQSVAEWKTAMAEQAIPMFNTNTTPFAAAAGEGNADPARFARSDGIERTLNNRGLRSLELFGGSDKLSREEFTLRKFDRTYAYDSELARAIVNLPAPKDETQQRAVTLLKGWNRVADESGPALPVVLARFPGNPDALAKAVRFLEGRIDATLGEVQRLHRGKVDLPLGGGPDVLNAAATREEAGRLVGKQGDSLIILVDFTPQGAQARSIIQYGSSNRPGSPHYADQASLFVRRELKPVWRTQAEIRAHLTRAYSPGE